MSAVTSSGELAPVVDLVVPPLLEVHTTRYDVIGEPPSFDGAVNATDKRPGPALVAITLVGATGAVGVATGADGSESALVPTPLVAVARQV